MMRLKEVRKTAGMTQRDVAESTGIPLGTLRRWEQGVNEPDTDRLIQLADLYGVSTDEILGSSFARRQKPEPLMADERRLLDLYRSADDRGKVVIMTVAESQRGVEGSLPNSGLSVAQGDR